MIVKLVRNRSFTLIIGDSKQSRLRRLRNGLAQGSVLVTLLFNIYTYDLPSIYRRDGVVIRASASQWVDLRFIPRIAVCAVPPALGKRGANYYNNTSLPIFFKPLISLNILNSTLY